MSRTYSEERLEDYAAKRFEYNGKKLTEYEALQEQRHIERGIRRWKREQNALAAAGLDTSEATAKVREWNRRHKDFLEQTGLKVDGTRTIVGKSSYTPLGKRGIITLTAENEDIVMKRDFSELSDYVGKMSDRAVRKWYKYHDERILDLVDKTKSVKDQAREACELRIKYREQARDLMRDQEVREELDKRYPSKTFEELIEHKKLKYGLSEEEAYKDILRSCGVTNEEFDKKAGV